MKKLAYEHFEIQLQDGEFTIVALISSGLPDQLIIKKLVEFSTNFEETYKKELKEFAGNVAVFADAEEMIKKIFL